MYITTVRVFLSLIFLGEVFSTFSYGGDEYIAGIRKEGDEKLIAPEGGSGRITIDYRDGLLYPKPDGKQSKLKAVNERDSSVNTRQPDWADGFKNGVSEVKKDGIWGSSNKIGTYKENKKTEKTSKNNISQETSDLIMSKHMLTNRITVAGKKLKVFVKFKDDKTAQSVINDSALVLQAKRAGLKQIEFHDLSGFSKKILTKEVK